MTPFIIFIVWLIGLVPAFVFLTRMTLRFPAWRKQSLQDVLENKSVFVMFSLAWFIMIPLLCVIKGWDIVQEKYASTKGPLDRLIEWSYNKEHK